MFDQTTKVDSKRVNLYNVLIELYYLRLSVSSIIRYPLAL